MAGQEFKKLNIQGDGVYIVKNGIIREVEVPPSGFGKTLISWEVGKPTRIEYQYSEKL